MVHPLIKVLPDPPALAREAAELIVRLADDAIGAGGRFTLALCGGSTPKLLYELLSKPPYRSRIEWSRVDVYFGDERCVPPDHPDSNYGMALEALLAKVPIPGDNVYRMRGELEPEAAAKEYGRMLKEKFGNEGGLDLILLGMGEDGHTASLFPGTGALNEASHRVVATYVEHSTTGPGWRITMTAPFINRARTILIMVAGASKAARVHEALEGPPDPQRVPVQLIKPASGRLLWLLDAAAAGMGAAG